MVGSITATAGALSAVRQLRAKVRLAAQGCAVAWRVLALLLAAGTLDMLWPWPTTLRGLFLLALIAYEMLTGARAWRQAQQVPREEQIAREIEAQRPELDNALIHAVQFGPLLARHPDLPEAPLLRREIARAEREAARLPVADLVDRAPLRRERRALFCLLGGLLLTALLFPRAYRFELPRFLAFWGDYPPFTLTDFDVSPIGAHVRPGEGVTVTVRVAGLMPRRVELLTGLAGEAGQIAPLDPVESGLYTTRLERLTRATWFRVVADTGQTRRFWIQVDALPAQRQGSNSPAQSPQASPIPTPYRAPLEALRRLAADQARLAAEMAANARQDHPARQTAALRRRQRDLLQRARDLARQMRALGRDSAQHGQDKGLQRQLARMAQALARAQNAMQAALSASQPGRLPPHAQVAARELRQVIWEAGENREGTLEAADRRQPTSARIVSEGSAQGGYSVLRPGASGDGTGASVQQAGGTGRTLRGAFSPSRTAKGSGPSGERSGQLNGDLQEKAAAASGTPPRGTDRAASRYPVEYRRLVQDYFKAVAGGK
ncbi:MAG TPA: hypothetical protein VFB38_10715 [Chthonomonadaceae bacterium]|nr:hypothetical protein [Chthonomonadaceae bacterium]